MFYIILVFIGMICINEIGQCVSTSDGLQWLIMVHTKCYTIVLGSYQTLIS